MHNIQISVQDSVYANFMSFLKTFKNNEIVVISEDQPIKKSAKFLKDQKELQETLKRIESGEAILLTQEEFEESINNCI